MSTITIHAKPARAASGWKLFGALSLAVLALTVLTLAMHADLVEGLRSAIRVTARTSFALFLAAFLASSLAVLLRSDVARRLVRERRIIGLAFAFSHFVHAVAIATYGHLAPEFWPSRTGFTNVPGTVGYVFILAMVITSFEGPAKAIGPAMWKKLHATGMWVIAAIFALSFFKRIPMSPYYALPFATMMAAMAVKGVAKLAMAQRRQAVKTAANAG